MLWSPQVDNGRITLALAGESVEGGRNVGEARDVITEEVAGAQVRKDLLGCRRTGELLNGFDELRAGKSLALTQFVTQELTTGLAPTAFADRNLQAIFMKASQNLANSLQVLLPTGRMNDHVVQKHLTQAAASVRIQQITPG